MHLQTSDQPILKMGFGGYTCNWGLHIAGLYETDTERDEIILGFLQQGAIDGDYQLYCPTEQAADEFCEKYAQQYPTCCHHTSDQNCFSILPTKGLYYPTGTFSPQAMDVGLNEFFADSQKNGPRNIRATAEMVWALAAIPGVEHLMAYEARLNYFIPGKPWVSICMYNVTRFSGDMVMNVLKTHPYTINGGVITENPYYQDPTDWLTEHSPQFLTDARSISNQGS